MTETVHSDYEVKSESAVCHWTIPVGRLHDITPTPTNAACVTGLLPGAELNGTILSILPPTPATATFAIIDFTPGMVYMHDVRNVLTYVGGPPGAEATWGPINIGDPVFYDWSSTMVGLGIFLSTAPTDNDPLTTGALANSIFGWVVPAPLAGAFDTDAANFPHGAGADATATTHRLAIMQKGSGL